MSKATDILENIKSTLVEAEAEMVKFDGKGVKASGGRLRKLAQESKKLWQDLRVEIMTKLKEPKVKKEKPVA